MNRIRNIVIAIAWFIALASSVSAQALNPGALDRVRSYLVQERHPDEARMRAAVARLAPENTELYLMHVAQDATLLAYVRMRALALLEPYADNAAVVAFLESRIADDRLDASFRSWSVRSYVRGVYSRNPARVDAFLRRFESDRQPELRAQIQRSLTERGRRPAGAAPVQRGRGSQ